MVPPDLLARMNRLRAGSIARVTCRTQPGTVESRTHKRGNPRSDPNDARSTSGPKLLPPIPSRTTSRMPRFLAEVAKALQFLGPIFHVLDDGQPAEAVGDVGGILFPESMIASPESVDRMGCGESFVRRSDQGIEVPRRSDRFVSTSWQAFRPL